MRDAELTVVNGRITTVAREIQATDLSRRALRLAALSAGLSDVKVELRAGSLLEPVADLTADLVVSNPPFVVSPAGTHTYRDGGLPLDGVCARLVGEAPKLLNPLGDLVLLANWVHIREGDWRDRVGGWLPGHGVDALVVQREVLDPTGCLRLDPGCCGYMAGGP